MSEIHTDPNIPLAAFVTLSAGANGFMITGSSGHMNLAFSNKYLTWSAPYGALGPSGAIAWSDFSAITFRRGRRLFSTAELVIRLNSGCEVVFDTMFPVADWKRLCNVLVNLNSTQLSLLDPSPPHVGDLMGWYVLRWALLLVAIPISPLILPPSYFVTAIICSLIFFVASTLIDLLIRRPPPSYPRITELISPPSH